MRKADYLHLVAVIKAERDRGLEMHRTGSVGGQVSGAARMAAAERIAREFTLRASVDRDGFLQACGIDP